MCYYMIYLIHQKKKGSLNMNITNEMILSIGLFFLLQLINVILSTMRSILTINAKPSIAAVFNAISYTFYNVIVKLITSQDMAIIMVVTFLTNLLGVYIAKFVLNKLSKDKLWIYNATLKGQKVGINEITEMLKVANIKYVYNTIEENKLYTLQIFAPTQKQSLMIKEILNNYDIKFFATEAKDC